MKIKLNTLNDANSLVKTIDKYDYDIDVTQNLLWDYCLLEFQKIFLL